MVRRIIKRLKALTLPPSTGIGKRDGPISIRLVRQGCTNREFFHISVAHTYQTNSMPVIEQVGSYDPMPNKFNEKLVAFNFERIKYWIGQGASVSKPVAELLGLAGFFPIAPMTYRQAWRNRKSLSEYLQAREEENIDKITEETKGIN